MHFADRLIDRARRLETPVCVGIDPRYEALPAELRRRSREIESDPARAAAWACTELAREVVDAVEPYACAIKPQAAFFEALGAAGYEALERTIRFAREHGLLTIADMKRGDIGSTSEAYARAVFGGQVLGEDTLAGLGADAVTVNPFLGTDAVSPFLDACDSRERGVFALVRTSNPSARELQDLVVLPADGEETDEPKPLFYRVAALVDGWGSNRLGKCGYSCVGAVAGATSPAALAEIRAMLPRAILLVPGYGAQGGGAEDVAPAFDSRGEGAVVNASRSIVFARKGAATLAELAEGAAAAARSMRDAIRAAFARRKG
jgi:orotidine-5'-phosphate decarboxylase